MIDANQIAAIDALEGNTLVAFTSRGDAEAYIAHRAGRGGVGYIVLVEATRGKSGLTVIWRDPVDLEEVGSRMAQARWLLERLIAELWRGGFPQHLAEGH